MITKLEYFSGGVQYGNNILWRRHPDLDDVVEKVNEMIEILNQLERKLNESKTEE